MENLILLTLFLCTNGAYAADRLLSCSNVGDLANLGAADRYMILSHPGFDMMSRYDNYMRCNYQIKPNGFSIDVECDFFRVEDRDYVTNECYDFLKFHNGDDVRNRKFCYRDNVNFETSSSNVMNINWFSDYSVRRKGFRCFIKRGSTSVSAPPPTTTTTPPPAGSCNCGQKTATRIVGGQETEINEWPWQVGLELSGTFACGGSLINDRWVLTAAHCLASNMVAVLGDHDRSTESETNHIRIPVLRQIGHPQYNSATLDYDFALLELSSPVDFDVVDNVRPVCLPTTGNDPPSDASVTITGWGTLRSGGSLSLTLQEAVVNVYSNSQCDSKYSGENITPRMICAAAEGKDSCQGDSGGPMVFNQNNNWELVGVTSWGYGCASAAYPGVYARVSSVLQWIQDNSGSGTSCPRLLG